MEYNYHELVALIRALVISSPYPMTKETIDSDFKEFMGNEIPFRKYGYRTLYQFLILSGEFIDIHGNIKAKFNESSSHIVRVMAQQNRPQED